MLIDLHCDLNVLVTEAVLHIFGRSTLFGKHGGVGVTKTVVIKLVKPKLCAGDMTDMLHDLSVVKHISDEIAVMYLGQCVERVPSKELFQNPLHPYIKALLSAIPIPDITVERKRVVMQGEISSPVNPKPGCRFAKRCPYAKDICFAEQPAFKEELPDHFVACHFCREINDLD